MRKGKEKGKSREDQQRPPREERLCPECPRNLLILGKKKKRRKREGKGREPLKSTTVRGACRRRRELLGLVPVAVMGDSEEREKKGGEKKRREKERGPPGRERTVPALTSRTRPPVLIDRSPWGEEKKGEGEKKKKKGGRNGGGEGGEADPGAGNDGCPVIANMSILLRCVTSSHPQLWRKKKKRGKKGKKKGEKKEERKGERMAERATDSCVTMNANHDYALDLSFRSSTASYDMMGS